MSSRIEYLMLQKANWIFNENEAVDLEGLSGWKVCRINLRALRVGYPTLQTSQDQPSTQAKHNPARSTAHLLFDIFRNVSFSGRSLLLLLVSGFLLLLSSCQPLSPTPIPDQAYELSLPTGFPKPPIPAENQLTVQRVKLGKILFADPILSRDSSISCASCHKRAAGMADNLAISPGIKGRLGFRNAPTLANVAYHPYFFKEGGSPTLEMQMLGPIEDENEMGFNAAELAQRLQGNAYYDSLAMLAYDRPMDLYVLTRAIASFQRTLISGDSPYDRYKQGADPQALNESALRGMELFFGEKTNCTSCHSGFDFSDYSMQNNGLYTEYQDYGRYRVSLDSADIGKFKVPSLRNIATTAPYMHDGSVRSLAEIVEHYNEGGKNHVNQSPLIRPLGLSQQEKADLVSFLEHLTDANFLQED